MFNFNMMFSKPENMEKRAKKGLLKATKDRLKEREEHIEMLTYRVSEYGKALHATIEERNNLKLQLKYLEESNCCDNNNVDDEDDCDE